jgi:predicted translin family RNA/ssDNA-binding protein
MKTVYYLIGALIALAQDLSRYAVTRAIANDIESITICRGVLEELNGKMLEFDFRNGPLRRKYDGLKYALRSVEDIVFELSLVDKELSNVTVSEASEPAAKRAKVDTTTEVSYNYIDTEGIDAIRKRMDEVDAKREDLIKKSRDVQKLAKQAIFSIQRGNLNDAGDKLRVSKGIASGLIESIVSVVSSNYTVIFIIIYILYDY